MSEDGLLSIKTIMIRADVWKELSEQAERVGLSAQELLSLCIRMGTEKPWTVVEMFREDD